MLGHLSTEQITETKQITKQTRQTHTYDSVNSVTVNI
jgi:hypothetical protein